MTFRLLPKDAELGWLPYGWLVYLLFFLSGPLFMRDGGDQWAATIAGGLLFLPLYFWAFWLPGRKKLIPIAGMLVLGTYFAPQNQGASAFFIYAAAFLGEAGSTAFAARLLIALLALIGLEAYVMRLHAAFWIPAVAFSALIGAVNIHYAQRRQVNHRLRLAHAEIERLAKVAERERIGRDLHDLLGHTLSVIVLKAELASKLAEKDMERAVAEIRDVERISREALAEVRAAVKGYRTTSLAAEANRATKALEPAGVRVDSVMETVDLAPAHEGVLALALREAVTNIVRHAQATTCRVRLRRAGANCELEVADDGKGGNGPEGFGLSGMRERIESLGGTFERDGSNGTRLLIRLPLPPA